MSSVNSYAEFILGLYEAQFNDCSLQYPALAKEFKRDLSRLRSAVDSHGIRFVLDVMPAWRKHFDVCLASQRLTPSNLTHFGCGLKGGAVPRFLRGLTLRVFDLTGSLKPEPDVHAIRCIRQLLGVARRFRVDCGPKASSDAVREFVRTDLMIQLPTLDWDGDEDFTKDELDSVSFIDVVPSSESVKQGDFLAPEISPLAYQHALRIQQVADYLSACLGHFDPHEVRLRHGPGAVSDQKFGANKYEFRNWPDRLDKVFPMADFACANYSTWEDSVLYSVSEAETRKEYPAKLCAVPKSLSTPRLIAAEPTSLQWCQQGIRDHLYSRVDRTIVGNFVDFGRQNINGILALEASHSGSHCTIDLSSASDRISCWHVERLLRRSPSLLEACRATRSVFIEQDICRYTPRFHRLRKYSTMGNATTFPIQSLFFLSIVLGSVFYTRGWEVCLKSFKDLGTRGVRVFGDDLIVPIDCAGSTVDALTAFGLKVNAHKTFLTGKFRESCGVDAYDGQDVTTVSILSAPNQAKPGSIVSSVDVHNNLCNRGWYMTSAYIRKIVDHLRVYKIRNVTHGSGAFGWWPNYISGESRLETRFNRDLQVREIRCHHQSVKARVQPSEGSAAVLQYFTEASKVVERAKSSLHFPVQRAKSSLKLGWVSVA
jgi:hypothetical protein